MVRTYGPPGSSLSNPIVIHTSSQSQPPSSQVDQLQSSSQPSAHGTRSGSPSGAAGPTPATSSRFRWTQQHEYDFIKAIKDNLQYQAILLPGHAKKGDDDTSGTKPLSNAAIYRTISSQIFRSHEQKSPAQMRQKLVGLIDTYRGLIKNESRTGQGLLLTDMRDGEIKTLREEYIQRYSWYELLHEMMIDRDDSDPDILVTGAGERRLRASDDEEGEPNHKGGSPSDLENDGNRSPYSQFRARGLGAGIYDDDMDEDEDANDDSQSIDPRLRQASTLSEFAGSSAAGRRSSGLPLPGSRSSSSLPSLGELASQSVSDHQRPGALSASASTNRPASLKTRSPVRSSAGSSSRVKAEATSSSKAGKAKARSSTSDAYMDQFSRSMEDDRRLQLEREETKRRRLDVRSQQIMLESQERERQNDLVHTQLATLLNRIDAMQVSVNARMDGFTGILTGVMARIDSLASKLDNIMDR